MVFCLVISQEPQETCKFTHHHALNDQEYVSVPSNQLPYRHRQYREKVFPLLTSAGLRPEHLD